MPPGKPTFRDERFPPINPPKDYIPEKTRFASIAKNILRNQTKTNIDALIKRIKAGATEPRARNKQFEYEIPEHEQVHNMDVLNAFIKQRGCCGRCGCLLTFNRNYLLPEDQEMCHLYTFQDTPMFSAIRSDLRTGALEPHQADGLSVDNFRFVCSGCNFVEKFIYIPSRILRFRGDPEVVKAYTTRVIKQGEAEMLSGEACFLRDENERKIEKWSSDNTVFMRYLYKQDVPFCDAYDNQNATCGHPGCDAPVDICNSAVYIPNRGWAVHCHVHGNPIVEMAKVLEEVFQQCKLDGDVRDDTFELLNTYVNIIQNGYT